MRRFLEMLKDYPDLQKKPRLLVNRHPSQGGVDLRVIGQSLGMQVLATVPSDGPAMMLAINEGIPVLQKNLDNAAVRNLTKLAALLAVPGDLVPASSAPSPPPRRFSLGWRRPAG
jgi:Flp pilus assembly CpaE family ATPase